MLLSDLVLHLPLLTDDTEVLEGAQRKDRNREGKILNQMFNESSNTSCVVF